MDSNIVSYYKERAKEYEKIYSRAERQGDLALAAQILQKTFTGKEILEIACGTGYWTEILSRTALSILATDINDAVIEIAKSKTYSPAKVDFLEADMFNLPNTWKYPCLFGGFIWSHIKLEDLNRFIDMTNNLVESGGTILFIDNNYVEGSNLPFAEIDDFGNTYQIRSLEDGRTYKILKNFLSEALITQLLIDKASHIEFINLQYYWILKYHNI